MLQLAYGDQRGYAGGYGGGGGGGAGYGYGYGPYGYGGGGGGGDAQRSYPGGGSQPPLPGEKTSGWGGMFASQDGEQHVVKMRGIPFKATEMEISEWFNEYATCQDINIIFGSDGRPSGNAEVTFKTREEAKAAMNKHKQNMGNRYVELFYGN